MRHKQADTLRECPLIVRFESLRFAYFMPTPTPTLQAKAARDRILRGLKDIPAFPVVVNQVLEKLNSPNANGAQVAQLVSYDPGLTSRILRMVNSSAYGIPRQVTNIQHAIAMLGFSAVRGLVLGASLCTILTSGKVAYKHNLDVHAFWEHALMVAFLSRRIASLYQLPDTDEIFSAGLLHNIGMLVLFSQATELDRHIHATLSRKQIWRFSPLARRVERELLSFDHVSLSRELAKRWQLPYLMQAVMEGYAQPQENGEEYESAVFCVSLAHYALAAMNAVGGEVEAVALGHIPAGVAVYFSIETDGELRAICEHIAPLQAESAEIRQALLNKNP